MLKIRKAILKKKKSSFRKKQDYLVDREKPPRLEHIEIFKTVSFGVLEAVGRINGNKSFT